MRKIPLTGKLGQGKFVLVDDEDFDRVTAVGAWHANFGQYTVYAMDSWGRRMHRFIMDVMDPKVFIDHKDHNGLNNVRSNLRVCTRSQNLANRKVVWGSSQYKGVSWCKEKKKWQAYVCIDKRQIHIGFFPDEEIAAREYDKRASVIFGEFAFLNFPTQETAPSLS
jgi:hypothetical protein